MATQVKQMKQLKSRKLSIKYPCLCNKCANNYDLDVLKIIYKNKVSQKK